MNRISLWYGGLSRGTKMTIICLGGALAVIIIAVAAYMIFMPKKVEVRYGTIVWDPIDGHVWEDNTQTAMVSPDEASEYKVEYVIKYSPEHEEQLRAEEERLAREQQELEESEGLESIEAALPAQQIADLNTLQQNIDVVGQDLITGLEMANELNQTRATLIEYRNQAASMTLPPELEPLRSQALQVLDLYIAACDNYLQAIASGDLSYVDQANALIDEANALVQSLLPSY